MSTVIVIVKLEHKKGPRDQKRDADTVQQAQVSFKLIQSTNFKLLKLSSSSIGVIRHFHFMYLIDLMRLLLSGPYLFQLQRVSYVCSVSAAKSSKIAMKNTILLLSLIFGSAIALQCDIPGECVGQLIGYTSENSSTECLSTCKGIISDFTRF